MDYLYTWTTCTHGLLVHMDYLYTWTTCTHGLLVHMDYLYLYLSPLGSLLIFLYIVLLITWTNYFKHMLINIYIYFFNLFNLYSTT